MIGDKLSSRTNIASIAGRPVCVLVVDDNRENTELLDVVLTYEGFLVRTATSGEEALASVAQQPPDMILLDVMMPGMNGFDVVAMLKGSTATKSIPIIMVTAMTDFNTRARARDAGAKDFLPKPIDRNALISQLDRVLSETYADYRAPRPSGSGVRRLLR